MLEETPSSTNVRLAAGPKRPPKTLMALYSWLSSSTVASFIAGGVAGAVSRTVVSPFERMKIIFQIQGPASTNYIGVGPTLVKMWKEEGWHGFMRGNGINCIRIIPYSAVQFSSYTVLKEALLRPGETELDAPNRLFAGAIAGILCVAATYPLDIVRTRLSIYTATIGAHHGAEALAKGERIPGMWETMNMMYRTEGGVKALYRGIWPTTLGVAPYVGLNFAVYEGLREYAIPQGETQPTAIGKLTCGAVSGAIAQTLTYPFDVLRRRFQVNTMSSIGFQYPSVWGALKSIVHKEGVLGLYKGLSANLLKVAPSMAASWVSFEMVKDFLTDLNPKTDF
ncbi:hypothetical protein CANCADRAFT_32185 [Tortispora caseinolytica NRRL Y-17796]|uniref:Mitochondrial carrier protein n=1 Tax=Tortispora caseinolytica NRRL Y-17796 TaxID=767744 RepID=A0A1E4TAG7_9ASCO|nr:hypothetical protein CANCADRAFT_32185 [Tortispora caseinolytica NRRL Y-17796]